MGDEEMHQEKLRAATTTDLRCSPGQLEGIIGKSLARGREDLKLSGVLGSGGSNLVLEMEMGSKHVAVRLPKPGRSPNVREVEAGHAAALVLSSLNIPVLVPGPLLKAPLPYLPQGQGHLTIMPKGGGLPLYQHWGWGVPPPSTSFKKTILADLAKAMVAIYHRPYLCMGGLHLVHGESEAPQVTVGAMHDTIATLAYDTGHESVDPGPYPTWKEFALNQISAIELLHGPCPRVGNSIKANCALLRKWIHKVPGCHDHKFYLVHPDFGSPQILVSSSGRVEAILDWDGANTGTLRDLAFFPPRSFVEDDEDDDEEMLHFFSQQLAQAGAPDELVRSVNTKDEDPREEFYYSLVKCYGKRSMTSSRHGLAAQCLSRFCKGLKEKGIIDDGEKVAPCIQKPWMRSSILNPASF